jgi:DNA replication and repair protein RecF
MEIMKVRSNVLNNLIDHQTNEYISFDIFYQKDCMDTIKEDEYKKKLQLMRDVDKKKSSTNFGPHRDDWQMVFLPQKIMANQCSTGEQKMLLLALLLSYICCVSHQDLRFFLILLDDITAYLDVKRYAQSIQLIHNLIEKQKNIPIQLFITSAKPIPTQINFLDTIEIINLEDYLEK